VALPDLALAADLSARGITPTAVHTTMLAVASSVVRAAAGSPIAETDSTVSLWALDCTPWLPLPGVPVTAVASVVVDGDALDADAYKLVYSDLWRSGSWGTGLEPVEVVVTMTHGLPEVPASIVNLVCDLAILGASAATEGSHDPRVLVEKIDDYSVTFADDAVASAMELPALTRTWLRSQFGGGAGMVRFR
jgi:hypothetical protein